jgi:hypothetical protein
MRIFVLIFVVLLLSTASSQRRYMNDIKPSIEYSYKTTKTYQQVDPLKVDTSKYDVEFFKLDGEDVYLIKLKPKK